MDPESQELFSRSGSPSRRLLSDPTRDLGLDQSERVRTSEDRGRPHGKVTDPELTGEDTTVEGLRPINSVCSVCGRYVTCVCVWTIGSTH